jgi:hypothetical protein
MAYIGKQPAIGNFVKLDAITTSATNTYNLTLDSVAFTPESANHMLVSLNGVIQAPQTAFSVSGSTITFLPSSGTLSSSDSIDFIMVYGNVLDIGTPSDSTVTNAKTNFVSTSSSAGLQIKGDNTTAGTLQLNCEQNSHGIKLRSPAHSSSQSYTLTFPTGNVTADKFLKVASVSGSGTTGIGQLSFADAGGGNFIKLAGGDNITTDSNLYGYYTSDYYNYRWIFNGVSSSGVSTLRLRLYKSSGAISSSSYRYAVGMNYRSSGSHQFTTSESGWNDTQFILNSENVSSNANLGATLIIDIFDPQSAQKKNASWMLCHERHDGGVFAKQFGDGIIEDTDAHTGINIYSNSGNFGAQHWALYGMKV